MTVNVNNNSPGSQYYTVGDSALVVSWDAFDIEPTVCASTERINNRLTFSLDTESYQSTTVSAIMDPDTSGQLIVHSYDRLIGVDYDRTPMAYQMLVQIRSADDIVKSQMTFMVYITDPCFDATIDLDYVIPQPGSPDLSCNIAIDGCSQTEFAI